MFETCEDLEDIADLHLLYKVIIGLCTYQHGVLGRFSCLPCVVCSGIE